MLTDVCLDLFIRYMVFLIIAQVYPLDRYIMTLFYCAQKECSWNFHERRVWRWRRVYLFKIKFMKYTFIFLLSCKSVVQESVGA